MKKYAAALLVAAIAVSISVCAGEDTALKMRQSLYLAQDTAQYAELAGAQPNDFEIFGIALNMDSVIPLYKADLRDIAASGNIEVSPMTVDGNPVYAGLADYSGGGFAGEVRFSGSAGGLILHEFTPCDSPSDTLDFDSRSSAIAGSLDGKAASFSVGSAKLTWLEGVGYTIITENADGEKLVTTFGMQQKDSPLSSADRMAPGVHAAAAVETFDEGALKSAAQQYVRQTRSLDALSVPSGNPITGGSQTVKKFKH